MPTVFDAATGEYKYEDPLQPLATANQQFEQDPTADIFQQSEALRARQATTPLLEPEEKKPFLAQGPGQAIDEVFRQTANAGGALITDYMDLASYVGDAVVETGNVLSGRGFNPDGKFMNDSDNPWTEWRINTFEPQTEVGMMARPVVRTGVALLTLPKTALKGILTPLSWLGKAPVGGKVATGAAKGINNAVDAYKAATAVKSSDDVAKALFSLSGTLPKGKAAKFTGNLAKTPWLYATYDDVGKAIVAGKPLTGIQSWMDSVKTSTKALTNFGKLSKQQKIKTIGEALAWDAFVAFNASGEGDALSDETFSDALKGIGINTPFAVSPDDDAVWRKFKQMGEGMILGGALNAVFDTWRVFRFAENFKAAGLSTKDKILQEFGKRAQEIGDGLGDDLMQGLGRASQATPVPPMDPSVDPWTQGGALMRLEEFKLQGIPEDLNSPVQNRLAQMEGVASQLDESRQLDQALYRGVPEEELMAPNAGNAAAEQFAAQDAQRATRLRPRDNSTFSAQSIRQAALMDLAAGVDLEDVKQGIRNVMPDNRVDLVQMLADTPPLYNQIGLEDGLTSYIRNAIYTKGLMEGWVEIGPSMKLIARRSIAADLDVGDLAMKQARAMDEATDLEVFQAQSIDVGESYKLAQEQNPPDLDLQASAQLADQELGDPAMANATENYIEATREKAAYELGEEVRLEQAELDAIAGETSDADVVRQMTGQDLNAVDGAYIEKAQQGRGWEVFTADGDLLGRAQTKKAAQKLADQQTAADKKALVNRARQIATDNAGDEIVAEVGPVMNRSDLKGKVTLTTKQIEELTRYPELKPFWDQLKGGAKKTFEFDMESMADLTDGFKALLQTAEIKGTPRARVLRNLADKFDTATKLLAPEARAQQFVDGVVDDATQLAQKGEICDWF